MVILEVSYKDLKGECSERVRNAQDYFGLFIHTNGHDRENHSFPSDFTPSTSPPIRIITTAAEQTSSKMVGNRYSADSAVGFNNTNLKKCD
jgi:hypothetical protein